MMPKSVLHCILLEADSEGIMEGLDLEAGGQIDLPEDKIIIRYRGMLVFLKFCKILVSVRFCGVCAW